MATTQKPLTASKASPRNLLCDDDGGHLLILDRSVDSVDVEPDPATQYAAYGEYAFQLSGPLSLSNMNTHLATARNAYAGLTSWGSGFCYDSSNNLWRLPMISGMGTNYDPTLAQADFGNNKAWFAVGGVAQHYELADTYQVKLCKVSAAKIVLSHCTHGRFIWPFYPGMLFGGWSGTQYTDGGPYVFYYVNASLKTPAQAYAAGADGSFSILSAATSDFGWSSSDPWKTISPWHALDQFGFDAAYTSTSASGNIHERWSHFPYTIEHEYTLSATALSKITAARGDFWLHAWIVSPFVYTSSGSHPGFEPNSRDFSSAIINGLKLTCAWDT